MYMVRALLAASAASLAIALPAMAADTPSADAQRFGARPSVQQISLSPDGTHVAILAAGPGRSTVLAIADLVKGGEPKPISHTTGTPERATSCAWVSDTRLTCELYIIVNDGPRYATFTRMVTLNSDGSDAKQLTSKQRSNALWSMQYGGEVIDWSPDGAPGSVLMMRQYIPEFSTGTHVTDTREGLAVEIVDATTLSRKLVENPTSTAVGYVSDGHGTVRIRESIPQSEADWRDRIIYQYRLAGSREWLPLSEATFRGQTTTGFSPHAVDKTANMAYGFDDVEGHRAVIGVTLDGTLRRRLLVSSKDADVDELIVIGRQRRAVGGTWVTDRRQQQFFDPELQKLRVALSKAIPNKPLINFIDASADEKRLLLFAGADNDAGTYYVFDKNTHGLEEVTPMRQQLADVKLATVQPISYPAADGTQVPAYLTLPPNGPTKNLPAIVLPHGGPGARDEWGFDWLAQFFAARGFAVIQPNFRGSAGYGEAWYQKNGFQSWKIAMNDVNDAGRWLASQGIAAPGKLAILGWSYGGYAALQSSALDPDLFKAIVAIAPVTDLGMLREEARGYTNFDQVDAFIGRGAHVTEGSPLKNAEKIKAPVLMFHGDLDMNVDILESREMANRLKSLGKPVELVEFHGLDHQLDDSTARATMLDRADRFLRASLGLPAGQ
jgi:dipeptidyl aminopeptidase/acylaminoacyl peptidase